MDWRPTAALLPLLVAGCLSRDAVQGRYSRATCEAEGREPLPCERVMPTARVSVTSIATSAAADRATRGTDLPERALAAYVTALADPRLSADASAFRANLGAAMAAPAARNALSEDRTVFRRTLIVTVSKDGPFNPSDRLEETEVTIDLGEGFRFDNWDTAATLYTTIDAGSIQLTQTRSTGQSLSVSSPAGAPVTAGLQLSAQQGSSRTEAMPVTYQIESLTVLVERGGRRLRVRRQGGLGIDLTGNTLVKVELALAEEHNVVPVFSAEGGYRAAGAWRPPGQIRLASRLTLVPPLRDVTAEVGLRYTMRHVEVGGGTPEEADDEVLLRTAHAPAAEKVVLVPARDIRGSTFRIVADGGANRGWTLEASVSDQPRPVTLCFGSYDEATEFLRYQRAANYAQPARLGGARLGFGRIGGFRSLTTDDLPRLQLQAGCS